MISRAEAGDAGEILTVQRAAYVTEAQLYGDPFLAPLVETLAQVRALFDSGDDGGALVLKAVDGSRIVGAVRARIREETCLVSRLAVAPDRWGEGVGTALMKAVEAEVTGRAAALVLFTGHLSAGNLRLYRRLGYGEFRRERVSDHLVLVHLRKALG